MDTHAAQGRRTSAGKGFERAARHSARVRRLRIIVPVAAVTVFVLIFGVIVVSRLMLSFAGIEVASTMISDGKLVIAEPRMDGLTGDNRAYRVFAQSATQELGGEQFSLSTLRADVELGEDRTARFEAASAVFDPGQNQLTVERDGMIETSDGLRAYFATADVDLEAGTFVTEQPVRVMQQGTEILADRLSVEENGARIIFEHNVQATFAPAALNPDGGAAAPNVNGGTAALQPE